MPATWDQVDLESDRKYFNLVEGEAEENRLNQKNEAQQIAQQDLDSIELVDPLTNLPIQNLKKIMGDYRINMDQIYIQSFKFDAETYLRAVHSHTSMEQMEGYLNKLDAQTRNQGKDQTRVQLIIDNYDSFLEAKIVLDNLNRKFIEAETTKGHLEMLDHGLKALKEQSQENLVPLRDSLSNIQDCVETMQSMKHISILLNLNREVQLALLQQDSPQKQIEKAVQIINE